MRRLSAKSAKIIFLACSQLLACHFSRADAQHPQVSISCFVLQVYKDSTKLPSPQSVRMYSTSKQWDLVQENGQYCLPQETAGLSVLDLTFRVGPDEFVLFSMPRERFSGSWNFYFGGKEFAKLRGLPKSAEATTSCMVEFGGGEPGTGMVISPCRKKDARETSGR